MTCMWHKQIGILGALTASSLAFTATITVEQDGSGDYTTITEAIHAATKGDTVLVGPGVYNEGPIYLPGYLFYLLSTNGPEETIVTPDIANAPVFLCNVTSNYFPYLFGFTISGGNTDSNGGGLQVYNGSNIAVLNCIFENNQTSGSGGGAWVDIDSVALFTLCTFRNNTAGVEGGGLANFSPNYAIVQSSLFESNTAGTLGGGVSIGTAGGALKDENTPPSLDNCIFIGNSAGVEGGGIHMMPSFTGPLYAEGSIDNCTITQNSAPHNGGIAVSARHLNEPAWSGGLFVRNSISYDNDGEPLNYNLENGRPRDLPLYNFSCSDNLTDEDVNGNIDSDPRFRSPFGLDGIPTNGDEDLQLMPGSPCIDRGYNSYVSSSVDYAGGDRILDDPMTPDWGDNTPRVDMGAYEFDVGAFNSLGLAFWTDDSGDTTPFLSSTNWYDGLVPQPTVPAYLNTNEWLPQKPQLLNNTVIGELNVTLGGFWFLNEQKNPVSLSLQEVTGPNPVWADLNVGPYKTATIGQMIITNTNLSCDTITIQDGQFHASNSSLSVLGGVIINDEDSFFGISNGVSIQGIDGEANPVVSNLGTISPFGPLSLQGTYTQTGTRLDGTPANGNASFSLTIPDAQIIVDGTATLAGGATFSLDTENPADVGSQFTIANATGGFGGSKFDYVLTTQSPDGRFVVVSYATNIGGGDSAIATVLSTESLLQGDPEVEAIGVTLSDALLSDIDQDGYVDLLLSIDLGSGSAGTVAVLLNDGVTGGTWNGFESFGSAYTIPVGVQPRGLDVGFVDDDDFPDVVVACYGSGTVVVLGNQSDVDPDLLDVVATLDAEGTPTITESPLPLDVWVGDLDGDSDSDILVTNEFDGSVVAYENTTAFQGVAFGNPKKSFPGKLITGFKPGVGGGIRDQGPLGNNGGNGDNGVQTGTKDDPLGPGGGIDMSWTYYATGNDPVDVDSGDLNGDGFIDAVTTNEEADTLSILFGVSGNAFGPANTFSLGAGYSAPQSVAIGDFDDDDDLDLVVVCMNALGARVTLILRNTLDPPSGSYGLVVEPDEGLLGLSPFLVRSADVDDDGDDDIVALTESSSFAGDSIPSIATSAITEEQCVGDFDGSGTVDGADLAQLLGAWGTKDTEFDLSGDGTVGGADLAVVLGAWGPCTGNPPLD